MNATWINPFLSAAGEVFASYGLIFERGVLDLRTGPYLARDINAAIGITGDIKGQVVLSMNMGEALTIVKAIVPWGIDEFNDIAKSCISELTNMLVGKASVGLERIGVSTDLSVPSLFVGKDVEISASGLQTLVIPFVLHGKAEPISGEFSVTITEAN